MHLHSWWYISSSETIRLLYYKQDCKMCITAIKSNLYQMMSFLPQVHWYVFLKLNHRGKNLVTMKTVKLWRTWMWWLRLGHNYTHLTSSMELLWLILLHITCVTHHPGNGEMNCHRATITHTCDPETCGLEHILIVGWIHSVFNGGPMVSNLC